MPETRPKTFDSLEALEGYLEVMGRTPSDEGPGITELDHGLQCALELRAVAPDDALDEGLLQSWRGALDAACAAPPGKAIRLAAGASRTTAGLIAARLLADDSESVMQVAQTLWSLARPLVLGADSPPPRIWAT